MRFDRLAVRRSLKTIILRYHYLAFDVGKYDRLAGFDYGAISDYVLGTFLKGTLKNLRGAPATLLTFVRDYVDDLTNFFKALFALVQETRRQELTFELFCMLNLSATLYPLTIRLRQRDILFKSRSK